MANNITDLTAPGPSEPVRSGAAPAPVEQAPMTPMSPAPAPPADVAPSPVVASDPMSSTPPDSVPHGTSDSVPRPLHAVPSGGYNPYDQILADHTSDQAQALKASMYVGTKQNPDRAADVQRVAQKLGLPAGVVARNYDQLKDQAKDDQNDYDKLLANSPKTGQWLSDPNNAAVAHDDVNALQGVEQSAQDHGVMIGLMHALESGTLSLGSQLSKIYALPFELANARMNVGLRLQGQGDKALQPPAWTLNNPLSRFFDKSQLDVQSSEPLLQINTKEALQKGDWSRAALGITAQAVQGAPQIAAMIGATALAGPEAAAFVGPAFMGGTMASGANAEALAEGNDVNTSLLNALGKGAIGAGGAHILSAGILNKIGAEVTAQVGEQAARKVMSNVLSNIALATGVEGANNAAMQFGNDFVDFVTGTKQSPFEDEGAKAAESFLVGGLTGGFLAAPGAYGVAHAERLAGRRAEFNAEFLRNLKAKLDGTKLGERAPEQALNFTTQALENTPTETSYIAPQAFDTYFQSKKQDALTELQRAGLLKEYTEAKEAGRDMQVKTADLTHKLSGEQVNGLADDIKFAPDQLSVNEKNEQLALTKSQLEELSAQVPQDGEANSREDQTREVADRITRQFVETGVYSEKVAKQFGLLESQRIEVRARRLGVSPLEQFANENTRIERADGEIIPGQRTYNQDQQSDQNALGFYSALNREVNKMDFKNIPAKDLLNRIQNMQGLKREEIENSGLGEFLSGKEKVSKAEVQDYLRGQALQIEEITHGDVPPKQIERPVDHAEALKVIEAGEPLRGVVDGQERILTAPHELNGATNLRAVDQADSTSSQTQYSKYKLPGGENYREVLFRLLPGNGTDFKFSADDRQPESWQTRERASFKQISRAEVDANPDFVKAKNALIKDVRKEHPDMKPKAIKELIQKFIDSPNVNGDNQVSGASDELNAKFQALDKTYKQLRSPYAPDTIYIKDINSERYIIQKSTDLSGKVTFELGGHYRKGQKLFDSFGEALSALEHDLSTEKERNRPDVYKSSHFKETNILAHTRLTDRVDAEGKRVLHVEEVQSDSLQDLRKLESRVKQGEKLSDSEKQKLETLRSFPFAKNWHEFVLKRLIRMAAEGGYDKLTWSTGDQSADHYDLSKQVEKVRATKNPDGTFDIKPFADGQRMDSHDNVPESKLSDLVGKDLADKIVEQSGKDLGDGVHEYSGGDLKIGGAGMRGFYDKILPDFLKKYGKKFGAEVGKAEVEASPERDDVPSLKIEQSEDSGKWLVLDEDGEMVDHAFDSKSDAQKYVDDETKDLGTTEVHSLTITPELRDAVLKQGQPLYQSGEDGAPRGSIEFQATGALIKLGREADRSTVVHELGHLYLEQMREDVSAISQIAEDQRTPEQLQFLNDADTTLKHLGVESFDSIEREHHETWARSFEAYLLEGRAPSAKLRDAFSRFRTWLVGIYRSVKSLNVELNPEIRQVMDRLLASQDAIDGAERELSVKPLFNDPKSIGMSDAEATRYTEAVTKAHHAATDELDQKVMAEYAREQTARYKEIKKNVREEIERQVNEQPDQIALSVLQRGKLPDGAELPEGVAHEKLSKKLLVEQFGPDVLKELPRGVYSREGGMDPQGAAQRFGFESAPDLVEALKASEKKADLVDRLTEERMAQEHGDLMTDGSMPDEALKAVHNEERAKLLKLELEHLVKNDLGVAKNVVKRIARRAPDLAQVRDQAEKTIGQRKVRDTNPLLFQRAEVKAAREATDAMLKGDMERAFDAKQRELLNHELWRAATSAREETEKSVDYMQKFKKASKIEQLGRTNYLDQINAIRSRFEFADVSQKELDRREQSLSDFIAKIEADGDTAGENVFTPDVIRNELTKTNYKNLTNEELSGVVETVKQLEHMAIQTDKLLTLKERQRKAEVIDELISGLRAQLVKGKPRPFSESGLSTLDRVNRFRQQGDASLIKMEQLFKTFDGNSSEGPWSEIFHGAARAQDAERDYQFKITGRLVRDLMHIDPAIQKKMNDQVKVPGIERVMTRRDLIGVALNAGNEGNYTKLRDGHGWSDDQIKFMLDHLSEGEINFVNGVHQTLESMWPDVAKLQKKLTGLEPDKIEIRPMKTKNGEINGGYYPLMYDSLSTAVGELQLATNAGKLVEDGYTRATTPKGHTKSRTGFVAPIDLDIGRLPSHISGVIKDLTHREWLIDANYIINNRQIREAVADHYGEPYQRAMSDWVKSVVNSRNAPSNIASGMTNKVLNYFRQNAMLATMGLSLKTILSHYGHAGIAADTVGEGNPLEGAKWMRVGFGKFVKAPNESTAFAHEKSGEMRHFIESLDRDFSDKLYSLKNQDGIRATIQKTSLQGIHWAVQSMAIPTWHAAFERAQFNGHDEPTSIRMADSAVRLSLGASGPKDRSAAVASDNALLRVMTMFSTPISAFYSRQHDYFTDVANVYRTMKGQSWDEIPSTIRKEIPRLAVRPLFIYAMTSLLAEIWSSQRPSFDDSGEEWAKWLAEHVALMPFMPIPGVREVVSAVGHGRDFKLSPLVDVGESVTRAFNSGVKYADGEGEFDKFAGDVFKASGYVVGLPTNQMAITGQYLKEVAQGDEHPDSLGEFAYKSLMRRPKH